MNKDEVRQIIWQELNRMLGTVLTGLTQDATGTTEDIASLLPGIPNIQDRPVFTPWGYGSRAPNRTTQLVLQGGNSPSNRVIAGHYDKNRPAMNSGETILYNQYGQQIRLENAAIRVGSAQSTDPVPLGNELKDFLTQLVEAILTMTMTGNLGFPTSNPLNASTFTNLKTNFLDNDAILSNLVFTDERT